MGTANSIQLIREQKHDKAFKELYKAWPPVRRTLQRMGSSREEAEDIFQEALIVFYRKAAEPGFALQGRPEHYLAGCCKFIFLKQKRSELPMVAQDELPMAAVELQAKLEEESKLGKACTVLKQLGERCREILLSFYVQQLDMAAIATKFGYASEASAKNQKYKCLESAREMYRVQNPQL